MTSETANKKIGANITQVYELIREAEELANKHNIEFSLDVAYGMGGWYRPVPEGADPDEYDYDRCRNKYGWLASSHSC